MSRSVLASLVAFASLCLVASPALAEDRRLSLASMPVEGPPAFELAPPQREAPPASEAAEKQVTTLDRLFALEGAATVWGGPLGMLSAAVDLRPSRYFAVNVGAGQGGRGAQYGASARFRLPISEGVRLSLGGGVSGGAYRPVYLSLWDETGSETVVEWKRAAWGNVEASLEVKAGDSGVHLRTFVGNGLLLNPGGASCWQQRTSDGASLGSVACPAERTHDVTFFYLGLAVGYSFGGLPAGSNSRWNHRLEAAAAGAAGQGWHERCSLVCSP